MIYKSLIVFVLTGLFITGCSLRFVEEAPLVIEEEVEVDADVIEIDTPEEGKERVLKVIREEMRIFDVVAHHDVLQEAIENQMQGQNRNALENIVSKIVRDHMDAHLYNRIEILLELENDSYTTYDVEWIFNRVSTKDLYTLMTLYEKAFYEKTQGWKD